MRNQVRELILGPLPDVLRVEEYWVGYVTGLFTGVVMAASLL